MMNHESPHLTAVFEAMADGVYIIDEDYNVVYMNQAMKNDFGQGIGKKCYEVVDRSQEVCEWCQGPEVFKEGKVLRRDKYFPFLRKTYELIELPYPIEDGRNAKLSIYRDITQRLQREKVLKTSQTDYRSLFEHVGCGVFVSTKEGKFTDANQALLDMLGYDDKEEFLNLDIAKDLYLKPGEREKFQQLIERDGRVIDYEVNFKRKDGTPVAVLLTGHVRYDQDGNIVGYEGINVDRTQRLIIEKELKKAHDFFNKIIQNSPNPIMAADTKGNIIIWNLAAEEALGYKASEVMGKMNITQIYPEGMARKVMQMMRSEEYGGPGILRSFPMVLVRQDGNKAEGNISAAILYNAEGEELCSVGIFVDLKEQLDMERALRGTQEKLLQSEKLAAMGRLTSQIAHELNNPLYGIMNTLELLKTEIPTSNKRRKILDMALSETVRLTDMLRKMLTFSKPDQEEKKLCNMNAILDELLLLHERMLQERDIKIHSELTPGLPQVCVSTNQMRQVFLNFISNARDAMPEGGTLSVKTWATEDQIMIEVADTGVGMRQEHINKIFDAFFTTKEGVKGVGLGLSVCYGFIQDHGGDIKVKSKRGEGTTFTANLPRYIPPAAPE